MKGQDTIRIGLLTGILVLVNSTACGAKPIAKKTAAVTTTQTSTPELAQADERVRQSKVQLETARKQLVASRALLKAAVADFQAARADRQALTLMTKAQSLADVSGLQLPTTQTPTTQPVTRQMTNQPLESLVQPRVQQLDFSPEPARTDQLPLR